MGDRYRDATEREHRAEGDAVTRGALEIAQTLRKRLGHILDGDRPDNRFRPEDRVPSGVSCIDSRVARSWRRPPA